MKNFDSKAFNGVRVSDAIRRARIASGRKQKEMAKFLGCPPSTYNNWEQGIREPPIAVFLTILNAGGLSVEELFGCPSSSAGKGTPSCPSPEEQEPSLQLIDAEAVGAALEFARLDKESRQFVRSIMRRELSRQSDTTLR